MQETEVIDLVNFAFSCYPSMQEKDPSPIVDSWMVMLSDLPFEVAKWSIMKCAANSKFFPSIAEIREAAFSRLPSLPTAEEAWEEVHRQMNGSMMINLQYKKEKPLWSHELIERTVEMMGLRDLVYSETPSIDRAQFIKFYNSFRDRAIEERQDEHLLALEGKQNLLSDKEMD